MLFRTVSIIIIIIFYDEMNQTLEMDISLLLQNHETTDSQNQ